MGQGDGALLLAIGTSTTVVGHLGGQGMVVAAQAAIAKVVLGPERAQKAFGLVVANLQGISRCFFDSYLGSFCRALIQHPFLVSLVCTKDMERCCSLRPASCSISA